MFLLHAIHLDLNCRQNKIIGKHTNSQRMINIKQHCRVITRFESEYRFLSNFYECEIKYSGFVYQSVEAAYQAQKCNDDKARVPFQYMSASESKKIGQTAALRPDWNDVKERIMCDLVLCKFTAHKELADKLISTNGYMLIEGNDWHDNFWGVCICKDCKNIENNNHLGEILMSVRDVVTAYEKS